MLALYLEFSQWCCPKEGVCYAADIKFVKLVSISR